MNGILRNTSVLCATITALCFSLIGQASAGIPVPVKQGEAEAVWQAQGTGGVPVENHSATALPAPLADNLVPVVLSPISSHSDDPFCVLDWHVIRVRLQDDTTANFAGASVQISLDGTQVPITMTAIKTFASFPGFYWRAYGLVVPPGMPTAGQHTLSTTAVFPPDPSVTFSTIVNIGDASSPSCTGR